MSILFQENDTITVERAVVDHHHDFVTVAPKPQEFPVGIGYDIRLARYILALVATDLVTTLGVALSAWMVVWAFGWQPQVSLPLIGAFGSVHVAIQTLLRLYPGIGLNPIEEFRRLVTSSTVTCLIFAVVLCVLVAGPPWKTVGFFAIVWLLCLASLPCLRSVARLVLSQTRWWAVPVLIMGDTSLGKKVRQFLHTNPKLGMRAIGLVGEGHRPVPSNDNESPNSLTGYWQAAAKVAQARDVYTTIIALPEHNPDRWLQRNHPYLAMFSNLLVVHNVQPFPTLWTQTRQFGAWMGVEATNRLLLPVPRLIKRSMDFALALVVGLLLLPLIMMIALLTKLTTRGPAFFTQPRYGKDGREFSMWKLRTMVVDADGILEQRLAEDQDLEREWCDEHKLRADPRITAIGRFLRETSLDELPQILNVLQGDMSFVGPRPIVVGAEGSKYNDEYPDNYQQYTKVRPGMTGLWQVSGRNDTTYQQRVQFDTYYVRNWSLWLDLYILVRTVRAVLLREGAY